MTNTIIFYLATAAAVCYAIYRAYKLGLHHGFSIVMRDLHKNPKFIIAAKKLYDSLPETNTRRHD